MHSLGSIALEVAELDRPGPVLPEEQRVLGRQADLRAVPADRYPRTASAADVMAGFITTEQFTWGLDRVLDGLSVQRSSEAKQPPPDHPLRG